MYIIIAILGFSLLVIVHELGHFIMAKINGITVEEFSIGMGPKVFSIKRKETKYSIGLLPIGGYVKMLGEEENIEDERSFSSKSPIIRIAVILAGAAMNVIFALVIFTIITSNKGFYDLTLSKLSEDSPAIESGLKIGDKILRIDGSRVFTTTDVSLGIQLSKGEPVDVLIDRNGLNKTFTLMPKLLEKNGKKTYQIGYSYTKVEKPTIMKSVKQSVNEIISLVNQTYKSIKMIVTGELSFKDGVGGPLTIIKISGQAAKKGFMPLGYLLGFISINLAIFNLLPFPALDGGWTVILLIELITRRKVPDKIVGSVNYIGFMILMGFMILVTLKDVFFPIKL